MSQQSQQVIDVTFSKKDFNEIYLPYLDSEERFLVFFGGRGSGKSVFIAQRYLYRCLKEPYFRLLYCRKVGRTVRNSQFQLFKDLIQRGGLSDLFHIKEAAMEIDCINGNIMVTAGMDDVEKIKSIQEITDVWMEEATEFTRDDLIQLNLCVRTPKGTNQLILSFNPISKANWIYESFFVRKEFEAVIVKTTFLDNRFLPPSYALEMERLKGMDENKYLYSALGEWGGIMEGVVFERYSLIDAIPEGCEIVYGLDFGFNHPTALTKVGFKDDNVYVQLIFYKSGFTNNDLINWFTRLQMKGEPIYCDAAEPQRIEEIYRAGYNAKPANKDDKSVRNGIDLIKSKNLFITNDSSELIKEIATYVWAKDKNGRTLEEPVKFFDDACDSMRYAIYTHTAHRAPKLRLYFGD